MIDHAFDVRRSIRLKSGDFFLVSTVASQTLGPTHSPVQGVRGLFPQY
jgi:hypothetical protein